MRQVNSVAELIPRASLTRTLAQAIIRKPEGTSLANPVTPRQTAPTAGDIAP
jgi:hypothetical protein